MASSVVDVRGVEYAAHLLAGIAGKDGGAGDDVSGAIGLGDRQFDEVRLVDVLAVDEEHEVGGWGGHEVILKGGETPARWNFGREKAGVWNEG
ncbi:MAG: hypothetical protein D4R84_17865 [Rhodocyclaceae bacterium]|nr:MAG: hypothetical protein D4R84_17865 [Rhodocyclaceae bacterium]